MRPSRSQWWSPQNKTRVSAVMLEGLVCWSLYFDTVVFWCSIGLVLVWLLWFGFIWNHTFWCALEVRWKSKQSNSWLNKQSCESPLPPSLSLLQSSDTLYHLPALKDPLYTELYDPRSQTRGADMDLHQRLLSDITSPLLSGLQSSPAKSSSLSGTNPKACFSCYLRCLLIGQYKQQYCGRPWCLWIWPPPEPTAHLGSHRMFQLSHRKVTLTDFRTARVADRPGHIDIDINVKN